MAKEKVKEELSEIAQATPVEEVDVSGDGHAGVSGEDLADERYKEYRRRELEKNIPGYGVVVKADDEVLDEMTRMNEREVAAYSIGDMQQEMANLEREESLWRILTRKAKKYKKSLNGDGIQEVVLMYRITKENEVRAGMEGANLGGS